VSAYTSDGYRVASEEEHDAYLATLCQVCNGEQRQAADFEAVAAFVDEKMIGSVCRPCAIFCWGSDLLEGKAPTMPYCDPRLEPPALFLWGSRILRGSSPPTVDPDRTLRSREMSLLIFASWMLRRAVVR